MEAWPTCYGWLVTGELPAPALRSALRLVDRKLTCTVADLAHVASHAGQLDDIVSIELECAATEPEPARICLARLAGSRLVLLVTTRRLTSRRASERFVRDLLAISAEAEGQAGCARDLVLAARRFLAELEDWAGGYHREPSAILVADRRGWSERHGPGASVTAAVGDGLAGLERWCAQSSLPFPAALLAGVLAVVARHSGQHELAVSADVPNDEVWDGPIWPPVIRLDWTDHGTVTGLVEQVAAAMRQAPAEPDGGGCPIRFRFEDRSLPRRVAGHEVAAVDVPGVVACNELTFSVIKEAGRFSIGLDFDSALYDQRTAGQLLARLRDVWAAWPSESALARLAALTRAEHRDAVTGWQGAIERYPGVCLHQLVEAQAKRVPDRVAVACGTDQLSYRELNTWSNRISRRLRELGVGQESVVAVAAGRAAGSVAGMLAVLKAGGCYLPVDPADPVERLQSLLSDSGTTIMVGAGTSIRQELRVTHVGLSGSDVAAADGSDPEPAAEPRNLAYVIYTSGTTGTPKGVMVAHSSIVCSTHARRVGGPAPDVDLVTMPLSFDGSAGGMYWALTTGGTVVLPTEQEVRDPHELARLAASWHVTHVHSVPSTYGVLLEASAPGDLADLKLVSVGGEPLPAALVARHIAACPGALLLNDYGPTEGTVWASAHPCGPGDAAAAIVPIGRPLPNYRLLILDEGLRLVPPGVPGDLYLGGDGTARGYLRDPALTAARFPPDPYSAAPGRRLYRTGDLARHRPDGTIELLGRSDDQVKVRGFRVELGEIQGALLRHPAVRDAAVLLSKAGRQAARVIAFVVRREPECGERSVRDWLEVRLPSYMRPDRVIFVESLPRNRNGKVDSAEMRAMVTESEWRR